MLQGNSFQCIKAPSNDPYGASYICGSDDLNKSLFIWLAAASACVTVVAYLAYTAHHSKRSVVVGKNDGNDGERPSLASEIVRTLSTWWRTTLDSDRNKNCTKFITILNRGVRTTAVVWIFYTVICLSAYLVMKLADDVAPSTSTESFQYMWTASSAHLHGIAPAVLMIVFACTSVAWATISFVDVKDDQNAVAIEQIHAQKSTSGAQEGFVGVCSFVICSSLTVCRGYSLAILLHLMNFVMMVSVNAAYVTSSFLGLSSLYAVLVQIALSTFKVAWSYLYIPWAVQAIRSGSYSGIHELGMNMFNFVGGPVLASLSTSPSCMYYVFKALTPIQSSYSYTVPVSPVCSSKYTVDDNGSNKSAVTTCVSEYATYVEQTILQPPWTYSYQCGSSIITLYSPVLIYIYTTAGLVLPSVVLIAALIPPHTLKAYLPKIVFKHLLWKIVKDPYDPGEDSSKPRRVFEGRRIVARIILDFGVLLTFGLANPLLATVIFVKVCVQLVFWKLLLGRYLVDSNIMTQFRLDRIELSTENSSSRLVRGMLVVVILVAGFWSLMIFDMIADVYGANVGAACAGAASLAISLTFTAALQWNKYFTSTTWQSSTMGEKAIAVINAAFTQEELSEQLRISGLKGGGTDVYGFRISDMSSERTSEIETTHRGAVQNPIYEDQDSEIT